MMTQIIPTQATVKLLGAAGLANAPKRSRGSDFEQLFAGNVKRETKIFAKAEGIKENIRKGDNQWLNQIIQLTDQKSVATEILSQDLTSDETETLTLGNMTVDKADEPEPEENINMELLGQLLTMLDQIRNAIMNELDLKPEELDSLMKDLGLEPSDLTEPQAIVALVLADSKSTEPLAMLLNEELGDKIQNLLTKIEDIKVESNLKLTDEEIKTLLEYSPVTDKDETRVDMGEAAVDTGEAIDTQPQPILKGTKEDGERTDTVKDADKSLAVKDEGQANNHKKVLASDKEAELKDTNDRKTKTDKADGFELFLDKLSANYNKPIEDFSDSAAIRLMDIREIAQQIIDEIRVIISPEKTSMELQLSPEHLGKVNLTISSREGVMTAHFTVQNDLAKEAIEGQLITLKDTLDQQGIKVDTIDVTVASYTFDQQSPSDNTEQGTNRKQRSGHKITFEEAIAMSEIPTEVSETVNLTDTMGNNIDYTA